MEQQQSHWLCVVKMNFCKSHSSQSACQCNRKQRLGVMRGQPWLLAKFSNMLESCGDEIRIGHVTQTALIWRKALLSLPLGVATLHYASPTGHPYQHLIPVSVWCPSIINEMLEAIRRHLYVPFHRNQSTSGSISSQFTEKMTAFCRIWLMSINYLLGESFLGSACTFLLGFQYWLQPQTILIRWPWH